MSRFVQQSPLLDKLRENDIVRVTVNANPTSLGSATKPDGSHLDRQELHEKRFEEIEKRIKEYLPSDAGPIDMERDRLPILLARAFGRASAEALPLRGPTTFEPLSLVRYADGQQMLAITGTVTARDRRDEMRAKVGIAQWPFGAADWSDVHKLTVPDLTFRERLFLEQKIAASAPDEIAAGLGFELGKDVQISDFITDYSKFYRFYPSLLVAEV